MAKILYPRFLTDLAQYAAVRRYWQDLFHASLPESELAKWKAGDLSSELFCLNGESTCPFGALNRRSRKGLQVVQARPSNRRKKISAYTDTFGENYYKRPIIYLKIWCELTEETGRLAEQLILHWLTPGMTRRRIHRAIAQLLEADGKK